MSKYFWGVEQNCRYVNRNGIVKWYDQELSIPFKPVIDELKDSLRP